jgi:hypothetical protein
MKFALVILALLFAAGSGWAFETGDDFLKECEPGATRAFSQLTEQEQLFGRACAAYIRGFVGGIRVAEVGTATKMICSPRDVEVLQAMRIAVQWMKEHHEDLTRPAVELIYRSLANAFPCTQPSSPPQHGDQANPTHL